MRMDMAVPLCHEPSYHGGNPDPKATGMTSPYPGDHDMVTFLKAAVSPAVTLATSASCSLGPKDPLGLHCLIGRTQALVPTHRIQSLASTG